MFNTKDIELVRITEEEFRRLRSRWYDGPLNPQSGKVHGKITRTIRYGRYDDLIKEFVQHHDAADVSAYGIKERRWISFPASAIGERQISIISKCVISNPQKVNHLRLRLGKNEPPMDRAVLSFCEHVGVVTCHQVVIRYNLRTEFTLNGFDDTRNTINGIYAPQFSRFA